MQEAGISSRQKITDRKSYDGYYISTTGKLKGKLVEKDAHRSRDPSVRYLYDEGCLRLTFACLRDPAYHRPDHCQLGYRRHPGKAPEVLSDNGMVRNGCGDSVVKECIGKGYENSHLIC